MYSKGRIKSLIAQLPYLYMSALDGNEDNLVLYVDIIRGLDHIPKMYSSILLDYVLYTKEMENPELIEDAIDLGLDLMGDFLNGRFRI